MRRQQLHDGHLHVRECSVLQLLRLGSEIILMHLNSIESRYFDLTLSTGCTMNG